MRVASVEGESRVLEEQVIVGVAVIEDPVVADLGSLHLNWE